MESRHSLGRALWRSTVTSVVSYAGIGMLLVCCPALGAHRLGGSARGALLISAMAVASLAANAILARWPPRGQPDTRVLLSTLVIGVSMAAVAAAPGWLTMAAVALRGQIFTTAASLKIGGLAAGTALAGPLAGWSVTGCLLAAAGFEACAAAAYVVTLRPVRDRAGAAADTTARSEKRLLE